MKLWQGRQTGEVSDITVEMGESISLDIELYEEDILGSLAHAKMLFHCGILTKEEHTLIRNGLLQIKQEIEEGKMSLRFELEDIHTHIETRLIEIAGDAGKRLHTARSRNDQVAVDTHLFVRRSCITLSRRILDLIKVLYKRAEESQHIVLPGYTHMQVAQPVRLSHHILAHFWGFTRDMERFLAVNETARRLPLGSGAMAGVNYETSRQILIEELKFKEIYENSMDAVASRDHILEFLAAAGILMAHVSRIAEEIVLWNSVEFGYLTLPDSLTTGSSIMPQKKNPDLAELSRGKTGRIYGNLMNVLTNIKGLPFTYNRDLQEDRQPLLDTRKQCDMVLRSLTAMMSEAVFHEEKMKRSLEAGFATATDLADALVQKKGIPFREAHHIAGALTSACIKEGFTLSSAPIQVRNNISPHLADDSFYFEAVDMQKSADKKISEGGTALPRQKEQLARALKKMNELEQIPVHPVSL